ncbi:MULTISPECIES: hypothetical protein [Peribacillus]|uniref:hypothetical protein n=1 Tax=Peribacillus TaxID=2675229 RepID=UPI00203E675D|nr:MULTISPECIES: hypothetical protein [Peribacillus]MCM3676639.1 hypothetical protein [Peribacillus simplex]MDQ0884854.1 putative phage gp36 major capsid-like protein [Peribacillus sp. V2I11]
MDSSQLLNRLKEVSGNTDIFSIFISTRNEHEDKAIIDKAKWLQSELYIRLKECEMQKVDDNSGVYLSGKIMEL